LKAHSNWKHERLKQTQKKTLFRFLHEIESEGGNNRGKATVPKKKGISRRAKGTMGTKLLVSFLSASKLWIKWDEAQ